MFPMMALSQVAQPIQRSIEVLPGTNYRTIGVKWWGEGAYERVTIDGTQTAAKTLTLVKENDLIINKIWVRNGSTAIASRKVDGCAASGEFPTFELDQTKVLPRWLHWITKTKDFWHKCDVLSQGTSGKNRIKPDLFLTIKIPLPPIEEQRRIVARIEELAAKIEEARGLRMLARDETTQLFKNTLHNIFTDNERKWSEVKIDSVAEIVDPNPSHRMPQYSETGIPFISTVDFDGPEIIRKSTIKHVTEQTYQEQKERCSFAINDILYSRIGTIGEARILTEIWPFALSHVLVVVKPKTERILPRFLLWYLRSDSIVTQAHVATRSIGVPDLGIKKIREFSMPLPSLEEQEKLVMLLDNQQLYITQLKQQQTQTSAELNALLPSILDKAFKGEL